MVTYLGGGHLMIKNWTLGNFKSIRETTDETIEFHIAGGHSLEGID